MKSKKKYSAVASPNNKYRKHFRKYGTMFAKYAKKRVKPGHFAGEGHSKRNSSCFLSMIELQKTLKLGPQKVQKIKSRKSKEKTNIKTCFMRVKCPLMKGDPSPDHVIAVSEHYGSIAKLRFRSTNRRRKSSPAVQPPETSADSYCFLNAYASHMSKYNSKNDKRKSISFKVPCGQVAQNAKKAFPIL